MIFSDQHSMHSSSFPDFMVFTGNANPTLAHEVARCLGIQLGAMDVGRFSDGEVAGSSSFLSRSAKRRR